MPPGGGIHAIKISRFLAKDFVRLTKFSVVALQRLQPFDNFSRNATAHTVTQGGSVAQTRVTTCAVFSITFAAGTQSKMPASAASCRLPPTGP
jgi:hypothetical protein